MWSELVLLLRLFFFFGFGLSHAFHFVVFLEEIDVNVVTVGDEGEFGVLTHPVSKVEVEVGIGGVEGVVLVPWVAIRSVWDGGLCDVTWVELAASDSEDVVKHGHLGVEVVDVVVDLDITNVEVVARLDNTSHFLPLRDGDGVSPRGRSDDGVVSEGNEA